MDGFWAFFSWLLGTELPQFELTSGHMAARAVVVYAAGLAMARLGKRRFLAKANAFDVLLGIVFGSVVSRAITGSAPFVPTLVAGLVLVAVHRALALVMVYLPALGHLIKAEPRVVVRDGEILQDALRSSSISENDLRAALRSEASVTDLRQVKEARLERNGDISVIERERPPRVLEVAVEAGVQTVRIRVE
jgi:uncharacterized membrane protein YcaP (DUF421 family)